MITKQELINIIKLEEITVDNIVSTIAELRGNGEEVTVDSILSTLGLKLDTKNSYGIKKKERGQR